VAIRLFQSPLLNMHNLHNCIAPLIFSVPSRRASSSRGCAVSRIFFNVADVTRANRRDNKIEAWRFPSATR